MTDKVVIEKLRQCISDALFYLDVRDTAHATARLESAVRVLEQRKNGAIQRPRELSNLTK